MQKRIPGSKGQNHVTLKGGHFLQEDAGIEFAFAHQFANLIGMRADAAQRAVGRNS